MHSRITRILKCVALLWRVSLVFLDESASTGLLVALVGCLCALMASDKEAIVETVLQFYELDSQYGVEALVTQMQHACQAAKKAVDSGADEDLIVAALLHDIGWKLAQSAPVDQDVTTGQSCVSEESLASKLGILTVCEVSEQSTLEQQRAQHDVIGATYLRMLGFREKIPHLIEGHVLAKRYFCYKDPAYHDQLSEGSKRTLVFQGGPMSPTEAAVFESDPLFQECMSLRRWDEAAKVSGLDVPSMASYGELLQRAIVHPRRAADAVQGSYVRNGNTLLAIAAI
eukprot:m.186694 g.186694  ORF g.186694 m.186694 type:complete len:285 (+) comp15412_c0_seq5:273-1127(+)